MNRRQQQMRMCWLRWMAVRLLTGLLGVQIELESEGVGEVIDVIASACLMS